MCIIFVTKFEVQLSLLTNWHFITFLWNIKSTSINYNILPAYVLYLKNGKLQGKDVVQSAYEVDGNNELRTWIAFGQEVSWSETN
jgi:hypothetical protein